MKKSQEAVSAFGLTLVVFGVFVFFTYLDGFRNFVELWNEYLEYGSIAVHPLLPAISILDFVGTSLVCYAYRKKIKGPKSTLECFISCVLGQYGGTTLTGYLLGQVPPWMMSWEPFTGFLIAWWLTFFCPGDFYYRRVLCDGFLLYAFDVVGVFNNGHGVTSWGVEKALNNTFHANPKEIGQSYIVCIICGTFSACGGGFLAELLGFFDKRNAYTLTKEPLLFAVEPVSGLSRDVNSSFLLATLYYTLVNEYKFLNLNIRMSPPTARGIVLLVQYAEFFFQRHFPYFDPLTNFTQLLLRSFNVRKVVYPEAASVTAAAVTAAGRQATQGSSTASDCDGDGVADADDSDEDSDQDEDSAAGGSWHQVVTPKRLKSQ